ncbi:MAG: hypothetical protein K2Q97_10010 [Burkholderiaceae bacterium]|nr:hypothetical protein [Burkholderiaceae bacterium]
MHKKHRIQLWALASIAALATAGCGGGSDTIADAGPMTVNAFAYVQPIAASTSDTAEPQDISLLVLSTTETDEPDTKL